MSASVSRTEVLEFIDDLLDCGSFSDYCHNGLQVAGASDVTRIAAAVSAHRDLADRAVERGADLVLVHHGLFWGSGVDRIDATLAGRLAPLLAHGINLAGYHLPLDGHGELGNNVLIARGLGMQAEPHAFASVNGRAIGSLGRYATPRAAADLLGELAALTGHDGAPRTPLVLGDMPTTISTAAVCSGGGADFLAEAAESGADVLITGEPEERTQAAAHEVGIAVICAGHHATEVFGVRELARVVADRFGLPWSFEDFPNPV